MYNKAQETVEQNSALKWQTIVANLLQSYSSSYNRSSSMKQGSNHLLAL